MYTDVALTFEFKKKSHSRRQHAGSQANADDGAGEGTREEVGGGGGDVRAPVVFDVGGYWGEWAYTIGVLECWCKCLCVANVLLVCC